MHLLVLFHNTASVHGHGIFKIQRKMSMELTKIRKFSLVLHESGTDETANKNQTYYLHPLGHS
jgi:hypothetical protein